jgi:hypothetical protein
MVMHLLPHAELAAGLADSAAAGVVLTAARLALASVTAARQAEIPLLTDTYVLHARIDPGAWGR